jgi:hypothetical protein
LSFWKYGKLLSNKGFKKTFIKLLVYIYTSVQLCLNFIFIILVNSFNFETQIIYMWSLKLFKVSEFLHVGTFDITCNSKFASNCVHCSLPTPINELISKWNYVHHWCVQCALDYSYQDSCSKFHLESNLISKLWNMEKQKVQSWLSNFIVMKIKVHF